MPDTIRRNGHRGAEVRAMMREKCTEKRRHNMPDNGRKESRHLMPGKRRKKLGGIAPRVKPNINN